MSEAKGQGNLLLEPVFSLRDNDGEITKATLPGVFARLVNREEVSFSELRPFQEMPWLAFLVQIAAMVKSKLGKLPDSESGWRSALFDMTGTELAWMMVTGHKDMAFMQPPSEGWNVKDIWTCPDQADVLITSRNHDVKRHILRKNAWEHWAFALVSVQTTWGYGGPFNYGVMRVRNAYSARAFFSISPEAMSLPDRFLREVDVWCEEIEEAGVSAKQQKHKLLWTHFWTGIEQIDSKDVHPAAVEICRIYKLKMQGNAIVCQRRGAKKARIEVTTPWVDPWSPFRVDEEGNVSRVALSGNPDLRTLCRVLFVDRPSRSMKCRSTDQNPVLVIRGMARDPSRNGMTAGYVHLNIPLPYKSEEQRASMGERALEWMKTMDGCRDNLKSCVLAFLQGGPENIDRKHEASLKQATNYMNEFEGQCLQRFFEVLIHTSKEPNEIAEKAWQEALGTAFRNVIERVTDSAPVQSSIRFRAIARCENLAIWTYKNVLPLFEYKHSTMEAS